ncbi:MAG TPA: M48 family metallopeptidase [Thermoanaerobaculia bacterium]|nr:M48 family metallopeptidase [Thermoanaerobaculia bacterium]
MIKRTLRDPLALLLISALGLGGCTLNPATGSHQLNFYGEESEIEMGREADEEIVATVGLYDDPLLQDYVQDLGMEIAAASERPGLPWSFKLLDDPSVNAFALPGGFVYVTRGLMTHLDSEAELAATIGHEVGHVTARHGVNQMSKQILASVGLEVAAILDDDIADWAFAGHVGLGLLFLQHGRDDERQADDLGLRYAMRAGYDPRQMSELFGVLEAVSKVEGVGRLPSWLSTHPDPGARRKRVEEKVAKMEGDFSNARIERDSYLERLDGMVFGDTSGSEQQEEMEEDVGSSALVDGDPEAMSARTSRIRVIRLQEDMTVEQFAEEFPSDAPIETVAMINHVQPGGMLKKGQLAKRIVVE